MPLSPRLKAILSNNRPAINCRASNRTAYSESSSTRANSSWSPRRTPSGSPSENCARIVKRFRASIRRRASLPCACAALTSTCECQSLLSNLFFGFGRLIALSPVQFEEKAGAQMRRINRIGLSVISGSFLAIATWALPATSPRAVSAQDTPKGSVQLQSVSGTIATVSRDSLTLTTTGGTPKGLNFAQVDSTICTDRMSLHTSLYCSDRLGQPIIH